MITVQALDFSGRPPGAAAIVAANYRVVIRYIGLGAEGKQISHAEWQDYLDHGVLVLLVAELGVNDAWEGLDDYALGAARARIALADIDATAPPSVDRSRVRIACAADAHASSAAQISDAVRYSAGFASVVGLWRAGFYGFVETSRAVHTAGTAGWHWRCGSKPSTEDQKWVNIWQRNDGPVVVNGTTCDINDIIAPWEDDDMATPTAQEIANAVWEALLNNLATGGTIKARSILEVLHREAAASYSLDGRPGPDNDSQYGHVMSTRAELREVLADLAELKAPPAAGVDVAALAATLAPALAAEFAARGWAPATEADVSDAVRAAFARAGQPEGSTT
ncbi:MAG: glycoside hydrolase domain-containing protein [Labedaea sp.]